MRAGPLVGGILLVLVMGMYACGEGSDTTIISTPRGGEQELPERTREPRGDLLAGGVGPVRQGTQTNRVKELFGPPDRTDQFSGCDPNPEAASIIQFAFRLPDGDLFINFEAANAEMTSYQTSSRRFSTTLGNRVGDTFGSLEDAWGSTLKPLDLGVRSTPEAGAWFVEDGPRAQLLFQIQAGKIATISGGYLPLCE